MDSNDNNQSNEYKAPSYETVSYSPPDFGQPENKAPEAPQPQYQPPVSPEPEYRQPQYQQQPVYQPQQAYQPSQYGVPAEIKGWNWGAFMMTIYWGIGNKVYITLLCLIPFVGWIWAFVCGACGSEWAWKEGNYQSVELFKLVQEPWKRAGKVMFFIAIGFFVVYFAIVLYAMGIGLAAFGALSNLYMAIMGK